MVIFVLLKIQDAILEVRIVIQKKNGNLPDTNKNVSVVNNIGHSMWQAVRLTINDTEITTTGGLYPYKAYISNLLTYDTFVKAHQLSQQGWYTDTAGHMEPSDENDGFSQRSNLFRDDFDNTKPYRSEGAQFFTRLNHDLIACESGLPPGWTFIVLVQSFSARTITLITVVRLFSLI